LITKQQTWSVAATHTDSYNILSYTFFMKRVYEALFSGPLLNFALFPEYTSLYLTDYERRIVFIT